MKLANERRLSPFLIAAVVNIWVTKSKALPKCRCYKPCLAVPTVFFLGGITAMQFIQR